MMKNLFAKLKELLGTNKNWLYLILGFLAGIATNGFLGSLWVGAVLGAGIGYKEYSYTDKYYLPVIILVMIGSVLGGILL